MPKANPGGYDAVRGAVIAFALVIFAGGVLSDLLGFHHWGPESDRWVTASGSLFWLALAASIVSLYDTVAFIRPSLRRARQASDRWRRLLEAVQDFGQKWHFWLGLAAIVLGALFGHFFWSPS